MQPVPAPSAGRGDVVLQPAFFTSVLYVQPLREDISTLTKQFREHYFEHEASPFSVFKQLWRSEGWKWLHFKVFDDRARASFLLVTARIFLGLHHFAGNFYIPPDTADDPEQLLGTDPIAQVVGLFGVYTFYYTQPEDTAPRLHRINHIPVPIDHLRCIVRLSELLSTPDLVSLREPVIYIASAMVKDQVFYVLPPSDLGPENPRYLPREVLARDSSLEPEPEAPKKKGRPSRQDKARKAQLALDGLNDWLDSTLGSSEVRSGQLPTDMVQYKSDKAGLTAALKSPGDQEALEKANRIILDRLREAQIQSGEDSRSFGGVERVERALREHAGGVLGGLWEWS